MLHFKGYIKETAIFYLKSDAPSSETVLKYFQHTKNGSYSQNKYSDNKLCTFDGYLATLIIFCSEKYHNLDKKSSKKKVALDPPTDYFDLPSKCRGRPGKISDLPIFLFINFPEKYTVIYLLYLSVYSLLIVHDIEFWCSFQLLLNSTYLLMLLNLE